VVEGGKFVLLGADTRATDDEMVADKRCEKIHCIAAPNNVWCCGAGTSADLDATTRLVQYTAWHSSHYKNRPLEMIMKHATLLLQ
jgi:20S proteasome alpha/beta subunit